MCRHTLLFVLICLWRILVTDASCQFSTGWIGTWFQSGIPRPLYVDHYSISTKGKCLELSGDKFLFEDTKEKVFRCVVMHEKHPNVLQYKEAFSERNETLEALCSHISGDAPLYSMFRVGATPVPCPLKGPFQFTYYRGDNRECKNPPSSIDVCTEDWRLLLRFQACPDVIGSESTVEELVCLANWKEGSMRYLVGKLHHKMATSDEDKYRCFVYEKNKEMEHIGFQLAQSGDATCNGLATVEGSRTLKLTKGTHPVGTCTFPSWMTQYHNWYTLDWKKTYTMTHGNTSFQVTNTSEVLEMRAVCSEIVSTQDRTTTILTYVTKGCKIGYVCMSFYQRGQHVIELQISNFATNKEEACGPQFDRNAVPYITLITKSPKAKQCPDLGKYNLLKERKRNGRSVCQEFTSLRMGCNRVDTIEFENDCPSERKVKSYECHASWEENGTSFLITSEKGMLKRFCLVYTENDNIFQFSSVHDSCRRNIQPGVGGVMNFNVTSNGQCTDDSIDGTVSRRPSLLVILLSLCAVIKALHFTR